MGEKTNSLAVFAVAYDCGKSRSHFWVQEKVGQSHSRVGNCWGVVRTDTLCWCFVWHERLLTATVNQELCQGSQVSSRGGLASCHREQTRRPPRLTWRCHPHQIKLHLFMEQISTHVRLANFREKSQHLKMTKRTCKPECHHRCLKNFNQYGNGLFHPNLFVDIMTN